MQSHTAEYTLNPIMDRERAPAPLALQIWAPDSVYPLATYDFVFDRKLIIEK